MPDTLPDGWTEAFPGGMATNKDPILGGIVDDELFSGLWFVIFNHEDLEPLDGFSSRQEAFTAHEQTISHMRTQP
jgi:hypothetical protein